MTAQPPTIPEVRDLLRTLPTAATSEADRVAWLVRKREMLAAIEADEAQAR